MCKSIIEYLLPFLTSPLLLFSPFFLPPSFSSVQSPSSPLSNVRPLFFLFPHPLLPSPSFFCTLLLPPTSFSPPSSLICPLSHPPPLPFYCSEAIITGQSSEVMHAESSMPCLVSPYLCIAMSLRVLYLTLCIMLAVFTRFLVLSCSF